MPLFSLWVVIELFSGDIKLAIQPHFFYCDFEKATPRGVEAGGNEQRSKAVTHTSETRVGRMQPDQKLLFPLSLLMLGCYESSSRFSCSPSVFLLLFLAAAFWESEKNGFFTEKSSARSESAPAQCNILPVTASYST